MQSKLRNILRYGGLEKTVYDKYEAYILRQDMKNCRVYFAVTGLGFLCLGLASLFLEQISAVNTKIYLLTALAMLLLFFAQYSLLHRGKVIAGWEDAVIYLYIATVYTESIALTVQHPEAQAVTYIAVTLMMPLLFARRPLGTLLLQTVFTVIFCICVHLCKEPAVAFTDIWNAVTFYFVSAAVILVAVPMRIKSLAQTQIIKELSEYDLLTGLKNRNSYEEDCAACAAKDEAAVVVYADANGLHELNNSKGHAYGDAMLRAVATALREAFGTQGIYRIGGDEFVILSPGSDPAAVKSAMDCAEREVEKRGYSISFGLAAADSAGEPLESVIKRAEAAMYLAKADYYRAAGNDRRRRR